MAESGVTKTVYGIYYPETRRIVDELWASRPHEWYERNYTGRQDPMHRPCLDRWRAWVTEAGVELGNRYPHEYPTAGASEAIHALLAQHLAAGGRRIHVLEGEYEGYFHVATALGLEVIKHPRSGIGKVTPGDQLWISQPSAIDGNVWSGFDALCDSLPAGVQVVVDLTYIGAVADLPKTLLDREPVTAVLWSLSKPFGVYYHRVGGLVSRAEVPALRGHHWFKNLFSMNLGERLMAAHPARDLPSRYRATQRDAIEQAKKQGELPASARPSDVVMLAHAPLEGGAFAEFRRAEALRFCMSPTMDRMIQP